MAKTKRTGRKRKDRRTARKDRGGEAERKEGRSTRKERRRPPPQSFWSGTISFGLINVPVDLFPATRRAAPSLRMLDEDGTPLARRYFCPAEDRPVSGDEIVRGYELDDGSHVVVRDEELEALEPEKSREIDLERFVDVSALSPLHFERGYFLTPAGDSNKAYRLLAEVMEATGKAGIATVVMRGKEYLVAILAEGGILRAETLRFPDEVRSPDDVGLGEAPEADDARVEEVEEAIRRNEADELDLEEMEDENAGLLRRWAHRKHEEGRDVVEPWAAEAGAHGDGEEEADPETGEPPQVDLLETIRTGLRSGNGDRPENGGP